MAGTTQPKVVSPRERAIIDELEASIMTIVGTQKGSVPGRPLFGVDLLALSDLPQNRVRGAAVREVRRGIADSDPRIALADVFPVGSLDATGKTPVRIKWKPASGSLGVQVTDVAVGR